VYLLFAIVFIFYAQDKHTAGQV